jgi:hypothetical protein
MYLHSDSSPAATTLNCASLFWCHLQWFQPSFPRPTRGFPSIGRVDYTVVVVALITIIIENTIIRRQKGKLQRQVEGDAGVRVANCTSVCCMVEVAKSPPTSRTGGGGTMTITQLMTVSMPVKLRVRIFESLMAIFEVSIRPMAIPEISAKIMAIFEVSPSNSHRYQNYPAPYYQMFWGRRPPTGRGMNIQDSTPKLDATTPTNRIFSLPKLIFWAYHKRVGHPHRPRIWT